MLSTGDVTTLVRLKANLSTIPTSRFPTKTGKDEELYFVIKINIEITHYSAYTKYEMIHDSINYGAVHAEYV